MTGDEFGEYSDIKELRNKAKDFYKNFLRGTTVRNPILGKVNLTDDVVMFTNIGLNKMGATSAQYEKLLLVKHLPKLIESADRVSAEENLKNKRNASQYSYLHSSAMINGKIRDVNITIFTDANGNRYYNHNLNGNAKTVEGLPVHLAQAPQEKDGIPIIGKPSEENITQSEEPVKYSLAGKKAKTADKSLLRRAMEMERRGANRDQIFQTTGWVKGKDNLWRFEIPDDLTKLNFNKLERDGKATLGEIYHNPKLYAAYPQLKNMRVTFSDKIDAAGNLRASTNTIAVAEDILEILPDRAKRNILHEMQHAIQKIEGFAYGSGKSNSDYWNLGGEQEAREVAARADMSEEKRRATTPTIHDENAIITSADKKRTAQPDIKQNETSNDESNRTIGKNDNSSESLTRKIKNKLSAYLDGKRPTERRRKRITENLRALSGHRILYGNVKGADDIVVDHMQKLIQSRNTYDWEKLLPVVGKEIAKQLKLNPTSEQSNYIADWLLTGALNNTSAEAKNFQKAMRDNPAQAELLQQTRDIFQEISDMTPWERVGSSLVERKGKTFLEKLGIAFSTS